MKVNTLDEGAIRDIGHAFGYYDYGAEQGLIDLFPGRDAVASYICGYVRMALLSGMLHATSERGEGFIAFKRPGEKIGARAGLALLRALLGSMNGRALLRFARAMAKSGDGLDKRLDREKEPYLFVGLVCVREAYQGQGYMWKLMELAYAEGARLGVPVLLETDAKSKCDKYVHLGMELAGTRDLGAHGKLYDLVWYPKK